MKFFKKIIGIIIFLIILLAIILKVGNKLVPIWNDEWINTSIVKDFYALPKNRIDVIAVGSSHVIKGFSGLELYKNYGITAYGIGTEQQSPANSLAWIKESLKTQKPKIILFETHMLFEETPEPQNRKGLDNMKLSLAKIECAITDSKERNSFENFVSIIFPLTRFHSRWKEVFVEKPEIPVGYPNYMGYSLSGKRCGNTSFETLDESIKMRTDYVADKENTFKKIIEYCNKKNIELIVYKGPDMDWDAERHNAVKEITDEYGLVFLDFNTKELADSINFDYANDCEPRNHTNLFGAEKVTNYLGKYISENYKIEDKRNLEKYSYVSKKLEEYEADVVNKRLVNIFNPSQYIETLKNDALTLIICKDRNFATMPISDSYRAELASLGIDTQKMLENKNYCAIIKSKNLIYEEGKNEVIHYETVLDAQEKVELDTENMAAIYLNGNQYSNSHSGINILVYNHKTRQVIECSYLDFEEIYGRVGR